MPCVNHPANDVQAYCQNCGKALCKHCVRTTPSGQVLCDSCLAAGAADASQPFWPAGAPPFYPVPPRGAPNPAAAAVLGLIPGVGAMYNGQLFKGLIHVVIFAVLVSMTDHYPIFGLFIAAWVLYQSFEAFHTAKARRDGLPIPDPFGLNELSSWLNLGGMGRPPSAGSGPVAGSGVPPVPGVPPPPPPTTGFAPGAGTEPPAYTAPYTSSWSEPVSPAGGGYVPPQPPYGEPYAGVNPDPYAPYGPGNPQGNLQDYPPGFMPPAPSAYNWRRREPVWAVVLIVLGVIFLLQSLGFVSHIFHYAWPVLLIGFGVWLIVSRLGYGRGGSK